jgi:hypothetical protein
MKFNKIIFFVFLLSSCSPYIEKLTLNVKKIDTKDNCYCKYKISGYSNHTTLKDTCNLFKVGDVLTLKKTNNGNGVVYQMRAYVPYEEFNEYFIKKGNSIIKFRQIDTIYKDFDWDDNYELIKK